MDSNSGVFGFVAGTIGVVVAIAAVIGLIIGGIYTFKSVGRHQRLADAKNQVQVTQINIGNTAQQVQVKEQEAKVRVAEAQGIRQSQDIISSTLTQNYLQHEAIQAQEKMANSPNHTEIYIPSGANGIPQIPQVQTVPAQPGQAGH